MELWPYLLYLNCILTSSIYIYWSVYNLEGLIEFKNQQFHNETQRVYSAVDMVHVLINQWFIKSKTCAVRYFLCCLRAKMRSNISMNGFAARLLLQEDLLLPWVPLFLGVWSVRVHHSNYFPQLIPVQKFPFFIYKAALVSGLSLHAACISCNPSLAQLHSNKKKTHYSRNKIHSYFCLIMHHININRLPKEKNNKHMFSF